MVPAKPKATPKAKGSAVDVALAGFVGETPPTNLPLQYP
jgi:hypothetical protein